VEQVEITAATDADAGELLVLTRACWVQEAIANQTLEIAALHESLADVRRSIDRWDTYVVRRDGRLVGSVRGRLVTGADGEPAWDIGRLMVAPDLQGAGLGHRLLEHIQNIAPAEARGFVLFTGERSTQNLRMYQAAGFTVRHDLPAPPTAVMLTKAR
jgi:tRNA (guanine37-N1)-methyltransferase